MLPATPVDFFLFIASIYKVNNPMLILTEEDTLPLRFCSGFSLATMCLQYAPNEAFPVANYLQQSRNDQLQNIALSNGDHRNLIQELKNMDPKIFSENVGWVLPGELQPHVPLRLDTRVLFYNNTISGYTLWESYRIKTGPATNRNLIEWSPLTGRVKVLTKYINIFERRGDLHGVVLTNGVLEWPRMFIASINNGSGAITGGTGYFPDVLSALQTKLNFAVRMVSPEDGNWGTLSKNGTWNGLVAMLVDGEVDIVSCGLSISLARQQAIDFSQPVTNEPWTLMAPVEEAREPNMWAYIEILPPSVWLLSVLCFSSAGLLFALAGMEPFKDVFLIYMGYNVLNDRTASKAILLTVSIGYYLLFAYFSCGICAKLTSQRENQAIRSFDDVLLHDYQVTVQSGTVEEDYMKNAHNGSAMQKVYGKVLKSTDSNALIRRVIGEPKTLYYGSVAWSRDNPGIKPLVIDELVRRSEAIGLQKDSEFTSMFTYHILKMEQSGLIDRIGRRWMGGADAIYGLPTPPSLGYENVVFPFALIAFGALSAGILMYLEYHIKRTRIAYSVKYKAVK